MTAALVPAGNAMEAVLIQGDLARLSPEDRVMYYKAVCESVGLNPLTKPFEYITLNSKLTLYARRDATDQLRQLHKVSIEIMAREVVEDCYVVTARATTPIRQDESIGAVNIAGLKGDVRANAMMKAETKAKRRVTLSICGLGMLDETEVETIPGARITPSAGVEEQLTSVEMQQVADVAVKMKLHDNIGDMVYEMENAGLNAEQQIILWNHFDSKQRSAMKKEQARMKAASKALPAPQDKQCSSADEGLEHPGPAGAAPNMGAQSPGSKLGPGRAVAGQAPAPPPEVISPAAHKRLEARITELKLDREAVKKYVKDTFGRDHFTEMTKDEYEKLDKIIEMRALKAAKLAQAATEEGP